MQHARNYMDDFRNMLIHGYSAVSDKVVWSIIENDLELLQNEVKKQLE
jgi:uncharacterized protein with HEPN domain